MARVRSVDFLPEIFQTPTNKQFLGATLDQLIQEPRFKKTQGYVGRRVGPGVNATDRYVIEPTASRTDYQLEPGVISLRPDTTQIDDVITYPGISNALNLQGADITDANRLYTSDYYCWDPFVDFDKFVNFSQYYWLPEGPDDVNVSATSVPLTNNFVVTRENGVYQFSGTAGDNPAITLVRGGNYTFQVSQNAKETVNFRVTNNSTSAYVIDYLPNPTLKLVRGNTYVFNLVTNGVFPFWIKTLPTTGRGEIYDNGVTRNGAVEGNITFTVPQNAPDTLYYACESQPNMSGQLDIINATPGTGPGFWIQSDPGITGLVPSTPNISSRDVLGVVNNGEDLGTVTFNVPLDTAQSFYYGLESIGSVDFATTLRFDQINNQFYGEFISQHGGIDGITALNNKTIIFVDQQGDPEDDGWEIDTQLDPLQQMSFNYVAGNSISTTQNRVYKNVTITNVASFGSGLELDIEIAPNITGYSGSTVSLVVKNIGSGYSVGDMLMITGDQLGGTSPANDLNFRVSALSQNGGLGTYDTTKFDESTAIVDPNQRYSIWRMEYVTTAGGQVYLQLNLLRSFDKFQKCKILYGDVYANTEWFRNAVGVFEQIPLLTAAKELLWYQDGTDPEIFGQIRLINQDQVSVINIDDILGKKNYISPNGVTFTNGLKVTFRGSVKPSTYENNTYYVEGVGTAIRLLPVGDFVTPEPYTKNLSIPYDSLAYDVGNYDASLNAPIEQDYLTINRASHDLNGWSRSNRWFHIDVINATAAYNETQPVIDNAARGKRPILEFKADLRLWDMGTQGKQPVNLIDFQQSDAFSNVNGKTGYSIDGYSFINGTRVIFASDEDPQVRNKIWQVTFITPDTVPPLIAQPIINLVPASDSTVSVDQSVLCLNGLTLKGKTFSFDGIEWTASQEKISINQPPLFNVYDLDGVSFGDRMKYPSSTFVGSKLFSYAVGAGTDDEVLGFPLKYLSLANVGDIVFENNLYNDTFVYVPESVSFTAKVSDGFVRRYSSRTTYRREIGWETAATKSLQRQQFQFTYDGSPLRMDIAALPNDVVPSVQVFVGNEWQSPDTYTVTTTSNTTTIVFKKIHLPGSVVEVQVRSDQSSASGFYTVPDNLENNPFNDNSRQFTLGTIRSHYETICENLLNLSGTINGANNTRDLGDIVPYGTQILQQSAPLTLAGFFMRNQEYNIFRSLEYNDREYIKFKNRLLDSVVKGEWTNLTASQILDEVITQLSTGKTSVSPFYWSDMVPAGKVYVENAFTITPITTSTFDTVQTYDFDTANYRGLLVFLKTTDGQGNSITRMLDLDYEYTVAIDGPRLTVTIPLTVGDLLIIREYENTAGNFVPNTPTKLGLYPAWLPMQFVDPNYVNPTPVIRGHDGSITVAFGDIRDDVLLEFEKRIFNNLKTKDNPVPLTIADVLPGYFRTTAYSQADITNILGESFLTWVGWNKIDYKSQQYDANDPFTYNYSQAGDKEKNQPLLGAWRGISRYFYDSLSPNLTPWEMLGFSQKPYWWDERYGQPPYTNNNLVLWDDIEAGYVAHPITPYYISKYKRPGLTKYFIPTGEEGQLLPPIDSVVGQYDPTAFRKSWVVGDGGPAEAAWWTSSSYPFAVMRLLALTRPAEFFSLFADRDLYRYDAELGQYLYDRRYRLDANGLQIYGNGVSKASFINWIVDFNQQLGRNSTTALERSLASLDVRLCWRLASFSGKQYLKIFTERSGPSSLNTSLLLPDESYNVVLYKNVPFESATYSAVIVQKVANGYSVFGYSVTEPYFEILASRANGNLKTVSAGGSSVSVPRDYSNNIVKVPYGFIFANQTVVVDFLLSYGQLLKDRGLIFDDQENGLTLNWDQMSQEFLYWANQGWADGSLINLNPCARRLIAERPLSVADNILSQNPENVVLDQNRQPLDAKNLIIQRLNNNFTLTSANEQAIAYIDLKFTNYEHMVVLDNVSIFNDLVYDPLTSARQNRVKITGWTSTDWNGTLDAQGFILNDNNVKEWQPNRKYTKGEIVTYKNNYWSAQTIVQPKIEFDYQDWVKSDYTKIEQGLLPNIANKADQLANTYDTNAANLERDNDLLSFGLIGFRPREYMTALNLDDISQVNLYQQFLKSKGTVRSAEIFTGANLGKETADYQIYENWAIQKGVYGANANRSFIELRLNESLLKSDPATIQVIQPGEVSIADQQILLGDIWKQSYKLTSPDILPTTLTLPTDISLPSAGYVNLNEVDITVFSLDNPSSISANLDSVGTGTRIWVAKSNAYDWDIYRCSQTPGYVSSISDNLDGTSLVSFTKPHGLKRGDILIIRFFNDVLNGVYRVLTVPRETNLTIAYTFPQGNVSSISGAGLAFFLQTMRVAQASDVLHLPYSTQLRPGAVVWCDNDGQGRWVVLEKREVFTNNTDLEPDDNDDSALSTIAYGSSVAQARNNLFAFVGAPAMQGGGGVYTYLQAINDQYAKNSVINLKAKGTSGFGTSVDIGDQYWSVVGAPNSWDNRGYASIHYRIPASNNFDTTQLLLSPTLDFGTHKFGQSVAISRDERWLYVASPGSNTVHAYGRVDVPFQQVKHITDGVSFTYNYNQNIEIDSYGQLLVVLDNQIQIYGVNYTINANDVIFVSPPVAGQELLITRRQSVQLDHEIYYNVAPNATSGTGSGATFTVDRTRGSYAVTITLPGQNYTVADTITINATNIGGGVNPTNNLTLTVTEVENTAANLVTGLQYIITFLGNTDWNTVADTPPGTVYSVGSVITVVNAGSGTGRAYTDGAGGVGSIYSFSQSGQGVSNTSSFAINPYLYTATNIDSFSVKVNEEIYRPEVDYDFNADSATDYLTLRFNRNPPAGASIIVTAATYWQYAGVMTVPGLSSDAGFGTSISVTTDGRQIAIGSPNTTVTVDGTTMKAGAAYVFDRSVFRYSVINPAQSVYNMPGTPVGPVSVLINGQFLTNRQQYLDGGFSVVGSTIVLSNSVERNVGDIIEIETNQFTQVQTVAQTSLFDEAQFGQAVKLCPTNCSLYLGAPNDGRLLPGAGSVDRRANQPRLYGVITSTVTNPVLTAGDSIRINNYEVTVPANPNNTLQGLVTAINAVNNGAGIPNVTASVNEGLLTISVINVAAATPFNRLSVLPGVGSGNTAFDDIGFEIFGYTQTIVSPAASTYAKFGSSISVDTTATNLVIGAPRGNIYAPVTFDSDTTIFDDQSTTFFSSRIESGVAFTYDYLPSATDTIADPGMFVFGQQIYDLWVQPFDQFGSAVDYTNGRLLIGSPASDLDMNTNNSGRVSVFNNPEDLPAWTVKHIQEPSVDVRLLNSVYMYDKLLSTVTTYLDFFNPLQGKILGVAQENIDYIGAVDPANYNQGPIHNQGNPWGREHLGEIWWDTNSVRFIDPSQNDIAYASRRWGQVFPGSRIDIYQWIESPVIPSQYAGPGTVLSSLTYTTKTEVDSSGVIGTRYYFWVRNIPTVNTVVGKKLSTTAIANYIENPRASGIAYMAPLDSSTVAIYNVLDLISAQDTILHVNYDRQYTDDNIHVEYALIAQDKAEDFLSDNLYLKMQDSFCGVNLQGAPVPDPTLSPADRYGVQFRPRQSMFFNRFGALQNYLGRANWILNAYPISETRNFSILNSREPEPSAASGAWNKRVANLDELGYQNLIIVPLGYLYLVASDSSQSGAWTIYQVINGPTPGSRALTLIRVQNYDTRRYWNYINWYLPGYNPTVNPVAEVPNYAGLDSLTSVAVGDSVKVTRNAQGKWEIYQRTLTGWDRVGLQDGTIEFSAELWNYSIGRFGFDVEVFDAQYFDQEPVIETRKIIQAINEELFVGDLLIERNRSLMLVFDYVYSEFTAPGWLMKTSLVDVDHKIRALEPYQIYRQDNQDFVLQYINEVKPYHVQVREFNLTYDGNDAYPGSVTDFDLPAYYDTTLTVPQFVSPALLPYTKSTSVTGQSTASDVLPSSTRWQDWPYSQWFNNYLLSVESIIVLNGGIGYTIPPEIVVTGECEEPAELQALVNSAGFVTAVNIINPGLGYRTTAEITFVGGNGTGARAYAVMGNGLVRNIKATIKYDRYQYKSDIVPWEANVNYPNGTRVRYVDRVWQAASNNSPGVQGPTFDPAQWTEIDASTLGGIDRTQGFYIPTANLPGLELPLLIDGLDYPGVQVKGVSYDQNTGFDVGNFDMTPYDNLSYGPEGQPTYDPGILDAIYGSSYLDVFLGTRPDDINVDGGAYVDTYSSHAPEELVPGIEFDTLDLRVYTTPGADWTRDGHGFQLEVKKFAIETVPQTFDIAGIMPNPAVLLATDQSTGLELSNVLHYDVDWANRTITFKSGVSPGDAVAVTLYGVGGGNQVFRQTYNGDEVGDRLVIPINYYQVNSDLPAIQDMAIFVNGRLISNYTYASYETFYTEITFDDYYNESDNLLIVVIAPTNVDGTLVDYDWSTPQTQVIIADGSLTYLLDNPLLFSDPDNLIVTVNGIRARTAAGQQYIADGSSAYLLPDRLGFDQVLIADPEVHVYINDVPLILGVDYTVEPFDFSSEQPRAVQFTQAPTVGEKITIYVITNTQAWVNGNTLVFNQFQGLVPIAGDVINVTTWNDPRQQNILTQVYVGPVKGGVIVQEAFDETPYDQALLNSTPGSYDYTVGQEVTLNNLFLQNPVIDPDRLWVTLNGRRLYVNDDFMLVNNEIILSSGILNPTDLVMITTLTNSIAPEYMAFRIFQDMRGVQATYRITQASTTYLVQPLAKDQDVIYVWDASTLSEPDLASNIWGVLTINGERIMYRERNVALNIISGLMRGTAGTAVANHDTNALVYDMGRGNLLSQEYQDQIVSTTTMADGSTTVYTAANIDLAYVDSTAIEEALEVFVGGIKITGGYSIVADNPVVVVFDDAPPAGLEVTLLVRRGKTWYQQGLNTASNGVALQDTQTEAARFLRGEI